MVKPRNEIPPPPEPPADRIIREDAPWRTVRVRNERDHVSCPLCGSSMMSKRWIWFGLRPGCENIDCANYGGTRAVNSNGPAPPSLSRCRALFQQHGSDNLMGLRRVLIRMRDWPIPPPPPPERPPPRYPNGNKPSDRELLEKILERLEVIERQTRKYPPVGGPY